MADQITTLTFDEKWEQIHSHREWGRRASDHLARFVRHYYPDGGNGKLALDLGCGAGAQTEYLASQGFAAIGIDASPSAIKRCIEQQQDATNPVYRINDVTDLPFDDNMFDLIVDVCCFQHLSRASVEQAIGDVERVLRPDGLFFSITAKWDHDWHIADTPVRTMRRDELNSLYAHTQLRLLTVDRASYTLRNGVHLISHWVTVARRK